MADASTNLLTYKFYSGDDKRNAAHFVAEAFPVNNVTFSANFSFYNDNFNDSNGYGLTKDQGWSAGGDVSWTPTARVALSLGYDHQEDITKERAFAGITSARQLGHRFLAGHMLIWAPFEHPGCI